MNTYKFLLCLLVSAAIFAVPACKDFDELNTNPNAPETVTSSMLATNLLMDITKSSSDKNFVYHNMVSKQLAWAENAEGYQYNNFGRNSFSGFTTLINVDKMIGYASESDKPAYTGLGLFVRAYKLFYLSLEVGAIPYSDALKGESDDFTPKYDTQKQVMLQVLQDLEDSENAFTSAKNFTGDPIHDGKAATWRKIVNSFRLKVLMYLSKKTDDTDLKVAETFAQIVANKPILMSNTENLQLVYSDKANQLYPFNNVNTKHHSYAIVTGTVIDPLKEMNDYRLFYYANPSEYMIETEKKSPDDWDAYPSIDPSMEFDHIKTLHTAKKHCRFNDRYIFYAPGEPVMRISFTEQNFIIAEAIIRGWLPGDAKAYYEAGVRAAMTFIANATPDNAVYHHGRPITVSYINDVYLTGPKVAFANNADEQLKQIWMQKYILYFMQHQWDSYYEYRRTGYPVLPINPATNRNEEKDRLPSRWMYSQKEYNFNLENLEEALNLQYGGQDKTNDLMWILQ